jgi:hypothetical protein
LCNPASGTACIQMKNKSCTLQNPQQNTSGCSE